ncbi:hypothetical protein TCAL_14698 [Tigriopus californicus]|uniref:Ig-like domain-containing protein n=1 Tax=Tigriopus californicus TaxID=6832 RepID=A0A553NNU1_TIGCA|nr:hypothetical protein TCAL_14698 [Tigriopus californicus]
MIAYDPDVRIHTDPILNRTQLTIENVGYAHSGNYTCMPSPLVPDSVVVQVITDEDKAPAAVYINLAAPRAPLSTGTLTFFLSVIWLSPSVSGKYSRISLNFKFEKIESNGEENESDQLW